MVFNLTHSQVILRYKENGGRIEPYTIVIMAIVFPQRSNIPRSATFNTFKLLEKVQEFRPRDFF
jgi:hypothetical protein